MSVIPFTSSFEVATQANCKFLHKDDLTPLNLNKHKLHIKHKSKSAKNAKIKTNKSFEVKRIYIYIYIFREGERIKNGADGRIIVRYSI